MRRRESQIGERVGLGLLGHDGGLGAAVAQHVAGHVVHGLRRRGVFGAKHRREHAARPSS